jgi:2-polyprenyl-3-methyl-5-hydroxy-6-metoxy-1,4-benzoquinol methylase
MTNKRHWEQVYTSKKTDKVSWFQEQAKTSLALIDGCDINKNAAIIDIGGGASTLVDDLLNQGYKKLQVLDLSGSALTVAKQRLGERATEISWLEADITQKEQTNFTKNQFDLWHDRAVYHFLTSSNDRKNYLTAIKHALKPNGHFIIATFAKDGPKQCSNLPIVQYSPESLAVEFANDFTLVKQITERHRTPFNTEQAFIYCHFIKNEEDCS